MKQLGVIPALPPWRSHRISWFGAPSAQRRSVATPSVARRSSDPDADGRLMSVQLRIGDGIVHVADEFPGLARVRHDHPRLAGVDSVVDEAAGRP
jgi:hypothetical protein